ncbi:MAG: Rrf2 family transcriptional regulator [Bacteroidetes bacterium]|nr:Rrf2 family transcriptional regulator [Bacteroidota bacterium]
MITSKSCQIATRALILLAQNNTGRPITVAKLNSLLHVGPAYLTKILQSLTQKGILTSTKGTNGGVQLLKLAKDISMKDIVDIFDGDDLFETCALGIPSCTIETPCAFHYKWAPIRDDINGAFAHTTIQDLADSQIRNESPMS